MFSAVYFYNILGVAVSAGVIIAAISFAYAQLRAGASQAKSDLIQTLESSLKAEKDKNESLNTQVRTLIESHQKQLNELNQQLGILKGKAEADEKKIKEYMDILANRSPRLETTLENLLGVAQDAQSFMAEVRTALKIPETTSNHQEKKEVTVNVS